MAKKRPGQITDKELAELPESVRNRILSAMAAMDESEKQEAKASFGASLKPSLTPIAQSLGKLEQISDPSIVSPTSITKASIDPSLAKLVKETSDSLKTMITVSRTISENVKRTNTILTDILKSDQLYQKQNKNAQEENSELLRRMLQGDVTTDTAGGRTQAVTTTPSLEQEETQQNTTTAPRTRPLSGLRRAGRALVGAAVGGAIGAGVYGILPEQLRDMLKNFGIDDKAAGVIGAAIGAAIAANLPFKEMALAAAALIKDFGRLGVALVEFGASLTSTLANPIAALTAFGVALGLITKSIVQGPAGEGYREIVKQPKGAELLGAMDSELAFATAITEAPTVEELVKIGEAADRRKEGLSRLDEREAVENLEYQARAGRAVPTTPVTQGAFSSVKREAVDQQAASNVTVITENTPDIPEEKAKEIMGGVGIGSFAETWKSMSRAQRQLKLRDASRKGIDLTITKATNTGFVSGRAKAEDYDTPELEVSASVSAPEPSTTPVPSSRLPMFNVASTEVGRNAGAASAQPMVIRGGDTINNVTNMAGGGGSSGGGSPSMLLDPWEDIKIGRRWAPYPTGWRR